MKKKNRPDTVDRYVPRLQLSYPKNVMINHYFKLMLDYCII